MRVISTSKELVEFHGSCIVPTMGALHKGHIALIERARKCKDTVIVSIFVNPTQFGAGEDLNRYPQDLEGDIKTAESAGADIVFAPSIEVMYPIDEEIPVPALPSVATEPELEDRLRPGHLAGVCQVVARLFDLIKPITAIFGEKDYQQLKTIEAMVYAEGNRWQGLDIISVPTLREEDGLALSSRNVYLKPNEREAATGLFKSLTLAHEACVEGRPVRRIEELMRAELVRHQLRTEYAVIRDAETLLPVEIIEKPVRALIAVRLGCVRLIDNM